MGEELVPCIVALPEALSERGVGSGPSSPHVLVCGCNQSLHLLAKSLRAVPLTLTLLDVPVAELRPCVRNAHTAVRGVVMVIGNVESYVKLIVGNGIFISINFSTSCWYTHS